VFKKSITNSQPFVKKNEKMSGPIGGGGIFFFDSHCRSLHIWTSVWSCILPDK